MENQEERKKFTDMIDWSIFNERVKALLKFYGLTQEDLAKELGLHHRTVNNVLRGYTTLSFDMVLGTANFFNVSVDYLLGRSEYPVLEFDADGNNILLDPDVVLTAKKVLKLTPKQRQALNIVLASMTGDFADFFENTEPDPVDS